MAPCIPEQTYVAELPDAKWSATSIVGKDEVDVRVGSIESVTALEDP